MSGRRAAFPLLPPARAEMRNPFVQTKENINSTLRRGLLALIEADWDEARTTRFERL
jgi:hypothetical protein